MANCLHCKHIEIYDTDLAILRLSTDQNLKVQFKCKMVQPTIRKFKIYTITNGKCAKFEPNPESLDA